MKRDPSTRKDGKCAVCGKKRVAPVGKGEYLRIPGFSDGWLADPFCSSTCCRKHHNCVAANRGSTSIDNRRGRVLSTKAERSGRALEKAEAAQ